MDAFKRGTHITQLPCEHRFCHGCIRKWLHDHRTCPVCRYEFPDCQTIFVKWLAAALRAMSCMHAQPLSPLRT